VRRILVTIACVLVAMPLASYPAQASPKPKKYATCAALNVAFPHGVSANTDAATAIEAARFYRPNVSKATYNLNIRFDTPRNGTVCEVSVPAVAPGPVTGLVVTASTTDRIDIRWSAPADDGGSPITSYKVTSTGGLVTVVGSGAIINGLSAGTSYSYTVAAVNVAGESSPLSSSSSTLAATTTPAPAATAATDGPMAKCKDGTYSYSKSHSGTCSSHGGVLVWYR